MLTTLLALAMMVSVIPGASAAVTQPQDDTSTIFRNPNRYYYVTEYTDYFKTTTITITEQDVATNQHLQNAISAGMGILPPVLIQSLALQSVLQQTSLYPSPVTEIQQHA